MTGHSTIIVASVYLSPSKLLHKQDLETLFSLGSAVILFGDFNAKHPDWTDSSSNSAGHFLHSLQEPLGFDVLAPRTPTHYSFGSTNGIPHAPTTIDLAVVRRVSLTFRSMITLQELNSDHRPILLDLGSPESRPDDVKTSVDWDRVVSKLENLDHPTLTPIPKVPVTLEDAELTINTLTSHFRNTIEECSRQFPADAHRWKLPPHIADLKRRRNAAIRAYDQYPTIPNKARMRSLQREFRKRIQEMRDSSWQSFLSEIAPSHVAYWQVAKAMKAETISQTPPLIRPDQTLAFEDEEKAELLADTLEEQCSESRQPCPQPHEAKVTNLTLLPDPDSPIRPSTTDELLAHLKRFKAKKAPGPVSIPNRRLKSLPFPYVFLLNSVFNVFLENLHFPKVWKEAEVIGIHKPGKPYNHPSSYRPISLLKTMGKLYECVILDRLKSVLSPPDGDCKIINEQFGFRAKHSCPEQVLRIVEYIYPGIHTGWIGKKGNTAAIFLDVAKAFDKVWHAGLVYKLNDIGVPPNLTLLLKDFLYDRTFRYRHEGVRSSLRPIRAGVPQGSVLSPILYSVYTNDIRPDTKTDVQLALFADDTALYLRSSSTSKLQKDLQREINRLGDWFSSWKVEVNPSKSAAIYFSKSPRHNPLAPFRLILLGEPIPWEKTVKYLGVTLDQRLSFTPHIDRVVKKARYYLGRLYPLLGRKSKMSMRNKITLYKTCIRPVLTYASPVFAHANIGRLQTVQNIFLRRAANAYQFVRNTNLHADFQLEPITKWLRDASKRFFDKAATHPNPLVRESVSYTPKSSRIKYSRRKPILFLQRRPKNALTDPPDKFSLQVQELVDLAPKVPANPSSVPHG